MSSEGLWARWQRNAEAFPEREAIIHWNLCEKPRRWTYSHLLTEAEFLAWQLSGHGIKRGSVCALLIRHHPRFYPLYLAIVALGAIPTVLAYPNSRLHPDKFREGLGGMLQHSGLDWILTERELEPLLEPLAEHLEGILCPLEDKSEARGQDGQIRSAVESSAILQHSSGTTGLQKPVLLTHAMIERHAELYGRAIDLTQSDRIVSWLPLYHDMGLIAAFHMPLIFGVTSIQMSPLEWVSSPVSFLEVITSERATLAWLPNFAYSFMADRIRDEDLQGVNLESLRMLVNCSEPIRHESQQRFLRRFQPYGLEPTCLSTCYAMAEATFAVTQSSPGQMAPTATVRADKLGSGHVVKAEADAPDAKICVSSGRPLPGCEIRILDEHGQDVPSDRVGELAIRSETLFSGYRNYSEKTARAFKDGWYLTGDLGFRTDGEYFIIGRRKDLIIVAGQNIQPEDIENAVSQVPGVLPGRVVAFGIDNPASGSQQIAVIVESMLRDPGDLQALRTSIIKAAAMSDFTLTHVHFAPPRWLVKSSSGKPSRAANARRISELER